MITKYVSTNNQVQIPNVKRNISSRVLFDAFNVEILRYVIMMTGDHNLLPSGLKTLINKMNKDSTKLTEMLTLLKYNLDICMRFIW